MYTRTHTGIHTRHRHAHTRTRAHAHTHTTHRNALQTPTFSTSAKDTYQFVSFQGQQPASSQANQCVCGARSCLRVFLCLCLCLFLCVCV